MIRMECFKLALEETVSACWVLELALEETVSVCLYYSTGLQNPVGRKSQLSKTQQAETVSSKASSPKPSRHSETVSSKAAPKPSTLWQKPGFLEVAWVLDGVERQCLLHSCQLFITIKVRLA